MLVDPIPFDAMHPGIVTARLYVRYGVPWRLCAGHRMIQTQPPAGHVLDHIQDGSTVTFHWWCQDSTISDTAGPTW